MDEQARRDAEHDAREAIAQAHEDWTSEYATRKCGPPETAGPEWDTAKLEAENIWMVAARQMAK